jgi:hypothetical protein
MPRDDFSRSVKDQLAKRVGGHCSNPNCHTPTTGPRSESALSVSIGVAAHIHAASEGGARYSPTQTATERADPLNGIWLCQGCAKLVDNDSHRFTAELLQDWKRWAEEWALGKLRAAAEQGEQPSPVQPIAGMSNQPTPSLACLEHLRLENIQAAWSDMQPMFAAARIMTDGAGVRLGWNVAELRREDEDFLSDLLDEFSKNAQTVSTRLRLGHHFLAVVAYGGTAGENEALASKVVDACNQSNGQRGIRVLIGFMAVNRFVDRVLTSA